MTLPFLLKKEPNRKYCQYSFDSGKHWQSIRKILPADFLKIADNEKKCFAWLTKYCADKSEQEAHKEREKAKKERAAGVPTLREYTDGWFLPDRCEWLKTQTANGYKYKKATIKRFRADLTNHAWPALGDLLVTEITPLKIDKMIAGTGLSSQSKYHIIKMLRIIFDWLEKDELIIKNPMRLTNKIHVTHETKDILTIEEIRQLWPPDKAGLYEIWGEYRIAVLYFFAMTAGLRIGEAVAPLWRHIDFEKCTLDLSFNVDSDREVSDPKSGYGRFVYLPQRTIRMLEEWRRQSPYDKDDDFIFFGKNPAKPMDKDAARMHFGRALENAKINTKGRKLSPHSLRHLNRTMYSTKLPDSLVDLMIGHRDEKTRKIYDHTTPRQKTEAQITPEHIKKINETWE